MLRHLIILSALLLLLTGYSSRRSGGPINARDVEVVELKVSSGLTGTTPPSFGRSIVFAGRDSARKLFFSGLAGEPSAPALMRWEGRGSEAVLTDVTPISLGEKLVALASDATGKIVAASGSGALFSLDANGNISSLPATFNGEPHFLALTPNGTVYAILTPSFEPVETVTLRAIGSDGSRAAEIALPVEKERYAENAAIRVAGLTAINDAELLLLESGALANGEPALQLYLIHLSEDRKSAKRIHLLNVAELDWEAEAIGSFSMLDDTRSIALVSLGGADSLPSRFWIVRLPGPLISSPAVGYLAVAVTMLIGAVLLYLAFRKESPANGESK